MANAARAYEPLWNTPAPRKERNPRERFEVVPGKGRQPKIEAGVNPLVLFSFKVGIIFLMILGGVGLATVWLQASTVDVLMQTSSAESAISSARAAGSNLEVQYSVLVNPTRIKGIASESLGMSAATNVSSLDLSSHSSVSSASSVKTVSSQATSVAEAAGVTASANSTNSSSVTSNNVVFRDIIGSTSADGSTGASDSLR